jgi:hypothetical protein
LSLGKRDITVRDKENVHKIFTDENSNAVEYKDVRESGGKELISTLGAGV